jgi:hypothetical protein
MHNAKCTISPRCLPLCIVHCALCIAIALSIVSCSVPKIESADCSAAREVTKRYYSLAIGGDLAHQPDAMAQIRAMLTPRFTASGVKAGDGRDPYNFSIRPPSSSRVDECSDLGAGKAATDVTVIWRLNDQNYLRKDKVTLIKYGDQWLIERIDVGEQPGPDF